MAALEIWVKRPDKGRGFAAERMIRATAEFKR